VFLSGSTYHSPRLRSALSTTTARWQGKVSSEPGPLIKQLAQWSGVIELAGIEACPLSEWLHRGLREAGIPVMCIETRHAQRFLSSRPVKTDKTMLAASPTH
jgi:transposase